MVEILAVTELGFATLRDYLNPSRTLNGSVRVQHRKVSHRREEGEEFDPVRSPACLLEGGRLGLLSQIDRHEVDELPLMSAGPLAYLSEYRTTKKKFSRYSKPQTRIVCRIAAERRRTLKVLSISARQVSTFHPSGRLPSCLRIKKGI